MDPENNEQNEQRRGNEFLKKSKEKFQNKKEKAEKTKKNIKIFVKIIKYIKIIMIVIVIAIIVTIFFAGFRWLIDDDEHDTVVTAKQEALGSGSGYSSSVVTLNKTDGTWDISVNDELKNKLTEAGIDITGMSQDELLKQLLMLYGISDQDFSDEELEIMPHLLKAEVATQYVDLRKRDVMYDSSTNTYKTLTETEIEESINNNKILGTVHLKRVNTSNLDDSIILEYIDYEEFKKKLESNNYDDIKGYFSLNDEENVVIASWTYSKTKYELKDGKIKNPYDSKTFPDSEEYALGELEVDYKPLVSKYTLPFEVLTALLINSEDVDFIKAVANLAFSANIEITIAEEMTQTTKTYVTNYYETIRNYQYIQMCAPVNGTRTQIEKKYTFLDGDSNHDTENDVIEGTSGFSDTLKKPDHIQNCTYKDINFDDKNPNKNPSYIVKKNVEVKDNTYKYGITYVDTWFMKGEKTISKQDVSEELDETGDLVEDTYKYSETVESIRANIPEKIKNTYLEKYYNDNKEKIEEKAKELSEELKISSPILSLNALDLTDNTIYITYSKKIKSISDGKSSFSVNSTYNLKTKNYEISVSGVKGASLTIIDVEGNEFLYKKDVGGWVLEKSSPAIEVDYNQKTVRYKQTNTQTSVTSGSKKIKYELVEDTMTQTIYDKKDEKFLKAYDESKKAKGNISSTPGWMEEMINEYNPNFTTIMTYLLDMYKYGKSDVDINSILKLFESSEFISVTEGTWGGVANFVRYWENRDLYNYYIGKSTSSNYADGKYYKVYYDGQLNLAYGIVISQDYNYNYFKRYLNVSSNPEVKKILDGYKNGDVFKDLTGEEIEQIYEEIIETKKNSLKNKLGLNLEDNQLAVLISISYQYGNIGNFEEAYKNYYLNGEVKKFQEKFQVYGNNGNLTYQPLLDTSTNNKECEANGSKSSDRVKANWSVFNKGEGEGWEKRETGKLDTSICSKDSRIVGTYTSQFNRTFIIYDQCDGNMPTNIDWTGNCNRAAILCVLSGYYSNKNDIKNFNNTLINEMTYLPDGLPANDKKGYFKKHNLKVTNKTSSLAGGDYRETFKETLLKDNQILIWINKPGYKGKSGQKWTSKCHWLAILDYKEENGKDMIFVADSGHGGSGWYSIDEFMTNGITSDIAEVHFVSKK